MNSTWPLTELERHCQVPAKVEEDPQIPSNPLVFSENSETHDRKWGNQMVLR